MHVVNLLSKAFFCLISAAFPAFVTCNMYLMYFFAAYGEPPHSFYTVIWGTPAAIVGLIGAIFVIRKTNMTVVHIISITGLVIITLFAGLVVILTRMAIKAVENGDKLESLF